MDFASDNTLSVQQQVLASPPHENDDCAMGYDNDKLSNKVQNQLRELFKASAAKLAAGVLGLPDVRLRSWGNGNVVFADWQATPAIRLRANRSDHL